MTMLDHLAVLLEERGLSITIWFGPEWVVWAYAADDPALGIVRGEARDLSSAIAQAIQRWDGAAAAAERAMRRRN